MIMHIISRARACPSIKARMSTLYWLSNTVHRPEATIKFHHQSIWTQLISKPALQTTLISIKNWNNWNFNMVFIMDQSNILNYSSIFTKRFQTYFMVEEKMWSRTYIAHSWILPLVIFKYIYSISVPLGVFILVFQTSLTLTCIFYIN